MPAWAWVILAIVLLLLAPWLYLVPAFRRAAKAAPISEVDDADARFKASNGIRCEVVQHAGHPHIEVELTDGTRACCGALPPTGLEANAAIVLRTAALSARTPAPVLACAEFFEHLAHENGALR